MRDGVCSEQTTSAPRMSESGFGSWPTLRSTDGERGERGDLIQAVRGNSNSHFRLPTLTASSYGNSQGGGMGRTGPVRMSLQSMAAKGMPPTLTVDGNYNRKGASNTSGDGLATALKRWPTLTANEAKNNGGPARHERNSPPLDAVIGGPLNPTWCEWLMGFPLGWTDCAPLEMHKFRQWLRLHGDY